MLEERYLIWRFKHGSAEAFERIYERHKNDLLKLALVLLRWKTGENEYRVIFGDLHADTVDADTLAKLEVALPQ